MKITSPASSISLFIFFLRLHKVRISFLILVNIFWGAIPSIDSILLKNIIDVIESSFIVDKKTLNSTMFFWAIIYGVWWETINLVGRIYDYLYLKTMAVIKGDILNKMYDYTQYQGNKFFQNSLAGHITNRITESSRSFEMVFAIFVERILLKLAMIIFSLLTIYTIHNQLALVFFVWICVFVSINLYCSKNINKYSNNYARQKAQVAGKIVDSIANISSIRMFISYRFERHYLNNYIDNAVKSDQKMQWFMLKLHYILGLSCTIMMFTIVYNIGILRSEELITIGDCILVISLCLAVACDLWNLTQDIGDLFEEFGAFDQSASLIQPYEIVDVEGAKTIQISTGEIEFKNVTFSYQNRKIFNKKSIIINGKQKVGLVGFSGSGKSTFINLVSRLYDVDDGNIFIDGQDIKKVTQASLRQNISIIPQEAILFHRTIMENIRYGKQDATDLEVMEAAKAAHIHNFIMDLPDGYNSLCGERGNNLSGGQKQRIVIARAILKNAPILILDEATSNLDTATENAVQESIKYLMENKTVLVIAHRLSTLLNMDRILVFDAGVIVEEGTHQELLTNGKLYRILWDAQMGIYKRQE